MTDLAHRAWPSLDGARSWLLVPVGSLEQHGPHLPLRTDTIIAEAVADAVADAVAGAVADASVAAWVDGVPDASAAAWVEGVADACAAAWVEGVADASAAAWVEGVADACAAAWVDGPAVDGVAVTVGPAVEYGASGEHQDFPGTVSIGLEALRVLLVELGRSATCWAERVVFVNGHGGNVEALAAAVALLRSEGRAVAWTSCGVPGADAHAGEAETSLLLHLAPHLVGGDRRPGETRPVAELVGALRASGVRAVSASGVLGDPTTATAQRGAALLAAIVERVAGELARMTPDHLGRLR